MLKNVAMDLLQTLTKNLGATSVKLDDGRLFGEHKIVYYCQGVYYLKQLYEANDKQLPWKSLLRTLYLLVVYYRQV